MFAEVAQNIESPKQKESIWQKEQVHDKVPNEGQQCIDVRWVITPKVINNVTSTKARLVDKGFQEDQFFRKVQLAPKKLCVLCYQ